MLFLILLGILKSVIATEMNICERSYCGIYRKAVLNRKYQFFLFVYDTYTGNPIDVTKSEILKFTVGQNNIKFDVCKIKLENTCEIIVAGNKVKTSTYIVVLNTDILSKILKEDESNIEITLPRHRSEQNVILVFGEKINFCWNSKEFLFKKSQFFFSSDIKCVVCVSLFGVHEYYDCSSEENFKFAEECGFVSLNVEFLYKQHTYKIILFAEDRKMWILEKTKIKPTLDKNTHVHLISRLLPARF